MDNKENRQFYWSVKDFGTKQPDPSAFKKKQDGVVDSVKSILEQNKLYTQKTFDPNSSTVNVVSQALSQIQSNEKGYNPSCKAYSKNVDTNAFRTLNEAAPGGGLGFGGGSNPSRSGSGQSWREKNPEQYAANIAKQQELAQQRKENVAASVRRKREDEAYEMKKERRQDLEMDKDNPNLPADTPANREALSQYRTIKQSRKMAGRIAELSGKDISSLSSSEAAELSLFKTMARGPHATKNLDIYVSSSLRDTPQAFAAGEKAKKEAQQASYGPEEGGGNIADEPLGTLFPGIPIEIEARSQAAKDMRSKGFDDYSQEELIGQSKKAGAKEAQAKEQENKAFMADLAAKKAEKMKGTRIQGTQMTYGEFEQQHGRPYDALNKDDANLVRGAASNWSAFRVSPAAQEAAQTADAMNPGYAKQNTDLARRQGALDRAVYASQMNSSRQNGSSVSKIIGAFTNSASPAKSASQTAPRTYRI